MVLCRPSTNDFLMSWFHVYCHPWIIQQRRKEISYLVGIRKKNSGADIANWRWCQFRIAKARPPNITCPIPPAQNASAIIKAWNSGLVHSNTERKENDVWLLRKLDRASMSNPRLGQCPSQALTYWATHCLSSWMRKKFLRESETSSRRGRWEQRPHRFHWWPFAVKHLWKRTSSQTWGKGRNWLREQCEFAQTMKTGSALKW